jgi:hypothetical protein
VWLVERRTARLRSRGEVSDIESEEGKSCSFSPYFLLYPLNLELDYFVSCVNRLLRLILGFRFEY